MSKVTEKLREKKAEKAREKQNAAPPPSNLTLEEAAAKLARMQRELERKDLQTRQLIDAERAKAKKAEARVAQIEEDRKREVLRATVAKSASLLGAIDPDDVTDLVLARHRFTTSPEGKYVREDDATADVDATIKSILDAKPHLVRGTVASGTGAKPAQRTEAPTAKPQVSFRQDPNAALRQFVEGATGTQPQSGARN